ncbi:MAG: alpha/beta hydrolase [Bacteroidota bacterium]
MQDYEVYNNIALQKIRIEDTTIGLRQIGKGKDLVFIHGFPTHGYTWRKIIPKLSERFKCHIVDLPGLGNSEWSEKTYFDSKFQANYLIDLLDEIGITIYSLIAHNSGATIAREIAIRQNACVENLIMFNTEIPNHRPPWIPFYQQIGLIPMVPSVFRFLLKQKWFKNSSMGFREFYTDKSMLDIESNILPYTKPVIDSYEKAIGALKYLKGIDWELVDDFKNLHKKINARTLFLWGENDRTFPIELGRQMINQFECETEFITIKDASLLPHEEKPNKVADEILNFLERGNTPEESV